ncbi:hypothetical protein [Aureispira sp. CCB-E]|uniref:hypothetical protein n=1 Tax=Aureispira sp. CCB-E TaxID=3051121 RepID=UPI002868B25B|nr:hypothetical protein [Aureispira sp. CCB-E]WMX12293.1 hypothetical protein QP953_15805 [Aureispira sp. CCB-E]
MENTKKLMESISKHASIILLCFALLSFSILIIIKAEYYYTNYAVRFDHNFAWVIGASMALVVEGVRFALMLSSAEDIRMGKKWSFVLGLSASIGLLAYEWGVCQKIGVYWSTDDAIFTNSFRLLALLGMVLELRLCLLVRGSVANGGNDTTKNETMKEQNQDENMGKQNRTKSSQENANGAKRP